MSIHKDQAICIRTHNYSETSQIITFFGSQFGRISVIAKGSRRPRAKFGGGIDLFNTGHILFITGRLGGALATLGEFEMFESFPDLRRHVLALYCAQYAADLVAEFTEDLDPHPALYDAFYQTLLNLQNNSRVESTLVSFELTLLREVGLTPDWHNCSACGKAIPPDQTAYFDSSNVGLICLSCQPEALAHISPKILVQSPILSILQNPHPTLAAPASAIIDAHELLSWHLRNISGKQTKIMTFVTQLLRDTCKKIPRN